MLYAFASIILNLFMPSSGLANNLPADFQLVNANMYACAVTNGDVTCWGSAIGTGGDGQFHTPKDLGKVLSIAARKEHLCALSVNGEVRCWDGWKYVADAPQDLGTVDLLASGEWHTCAATKFNVRCWGSSSGNLNKNLPSDLGQIIGLGVGYGHACANTSAGVQCWGDHVKDYVVPQPSGLGQVDKLLVGDFVVCALKNQKVFCWGGANKKDPRLTEIPQDLDPIVDIMSLGKGHVCAMTSSGPRCWGSNTFGQTRIPTYPESIARIISLGGANTCALTETYGLRCWGYDMPHVPPDFVIPSYYPSRLAGDWKCIGKSEHFESGSNLSCDTDSYKVYHIDTDFFTRGDLKCGPKRGIITLFSIQHIRNGNELLDMNRKPIGYISNDDVHVKFDSGYGTTVEWTMQVAPDGNHMTQVHSVYHNNLQPISLITIDCIR